MAFLGVPLLVTNAQPVGLGAGAGPGDEPAEGQGHLGRVAQSLGDHGCPQGQDRGVVRAIDREQLADTLRYIILSTVKRGEVDGVEVGFVSFFTRAAARGWQP